MTRTLTKNHSLSPNGLDDVSHNSSGNPSLDTVLGVRLSRRQLLKGSFGMAASGLMGAGLVGCGTTGGEAAAATTPALRMNFTAVGKNMLDTVTIPAGYATSVLYRLGDPLNLSAGAYANDGSDSADSFLARAGDHHDSIAWFGLNAAGTARDVSGSARGLLAMNHENITQIFLHTAAEVAAGFPTTGRVRAQIDKEVNAHGISVVETINSAGAFAINKLSGFNRRLTAASDMELSGPAQGNDLVKTPWSVTGLKTRGTLNNCAHGVTPWGTYLTCEENWAGYFKRPASAAIATTKTQAAQNRYMGASASNGSYGWANPVGGDTSGNGLYARWDITPSGADGTVDYRNAANTMGWVVEIDPYNPVALPRKRTALGRFGHEGAMPAPVTVGKPVVFYMGDDAKGEYIYKFVSTANWDAADANGGLAAGNKYLNAGKLYVATYNADGTGTWKELHIGNPLIAAGVVTSGFSYSFTDQADVLINCRIAADAVGATPMDRPEWAGVHPLTGDVYVTLTKNDDRGKTGTTTGGKSRALDAANPRYYDDGEGNKGNPNGHIIRMRETGSDPAATAFRWDIYLFGAETGLDATSINISGLTDDNDFSSPDGLWFSAAVPGLMWLQTDDNSYTDVSNCMMLAALPGQYGDGGPATVNNLAVPSNGNAAQAVNTFVGADATPATLKRFLVGPKGCEITGICETPDGKTIFVNIQHPGENTTAPNIAIPANFESHWPDGGTARPRTSTIVITKTDGGLVGS